MVILKAEYKLHPRISSDEYLEEIEKRNIQGTSRNASGNIFYDFYLSADDPGSVILMSAWEDDEDILKYKESDSFASLSSVKDMMVRSSESYILSGGKNKEFSL